MKYQKYCTVAGSLLLLTLALSSCSTNTQQQQANVAQASAPKAAKLNTIEAPAQPTTLPVMYQNAAYIVDRNEAEDLSITEESKLKVGARITSTRGPQPLWDIVKRLASLKGMNVSWASDVDKNVMVDVDINANDDYYDALDNMLRQVDYYHEMDGNTIVIKYKETRQYQIAMPFTIQEFSTGTGGNLLGDTAESTNVQGTINLNSTKNEFDIWENIKLNIESIMDLWSYRREQALVDERASDAGGGKEGARNYKAGTSGQTAANTSSDTQDSEKKDESANKKQVSGGQGYYIIDKPVGLITVSAPRPILEKIDKYITTLKKSLYQQISIEAKILEVVLNDTSSLGINWTDVLKNFQLSGWLDFGLNGQIHPDSGGQFIQRITLGDKSFGFLLNALNEQGDTKVLSNPKISVMNGQPALITVGRNVTYIDSIESDRDTDTNVVTLTVNTERILSGIGMGLTATVLGKDEIIMNLTPVTSELDEEIEYRDIGFDGGTVGLPIVNVREMSTTVKVKDGEMLVIGGLISESNQSNGEFAPGLGGIPGLKYLFGWEEKKRLKRELIILLRPRII